MFVILTGEDWNAHMFLGMKAVGHLSAIYYLVVVLFGNFLILNLFIAILMFSFEQQSEKNRVLIEAARIKKEDDEAQRQEQLAMQKRGIDTTTKGDITKRYY